MPSGFGKAVVVVADAGRCDAVDAEAQGAQLLYSRLVTLDRGTGQLDRRVAHRTPIRVEYGFAVLLCYALERGPQLGTATQLCGSSFRRGNDSGCCLTRPDHLP